MAELETESVDAIVTDPPYGLSFMGKDWDHGVPGEAFWAEALRVAKPGAHLLAFGGTRTFHRLACAIEDAGWEIRDCLGWLYGSGFPKSLDVSKAIDKAAGAEREVTRVGTRHSTSGFDVRASYEREQRVTPATPDAERWQGWGTALKPAIEYIVCAHKPLTEAAERCTIVENLTRLEAQLWSLLPAKVAEESFGLSQHDYDAACASAQWTAGDKSNTQAALRGQMDMSQFASVMTSCLSIVRSWRIISGESLGQANTSTTATETRQTTDWQTLNSCVLGLTPLAIIKAACAQPGAWWLALPAARYLNAALVSSASIRTTSVPASAISSVAGRTLRPDWCPIFLARKPLAGTVAANVLAHGTGGLNIDGCRVGTETVRINTFDDGAKPFGNGAGHPYTGRASTGRWPANIVHDGSDEVLELFPESNGSGPARTLKRSAKPEQQGWGMNTLASDEVGLQDAGKGSASRFFYCAKASKADRDEGCETLGERAGKRTLSGGADTRGRPTPVNCNTHPTVKPTALMRYLCRLITPPGGIILDPFCGSGSTGKAAVLEGFDFIGIDLSPEYIAIADARIAAVSRQEALALA